MKKIILALSIMSFTAYYFYQESSYIEKDIGNQELSDEKLLSILEREKVEKSFFSSHAMSHGNDINLEKPSIEVLLASKNLNTEKVNYCVNCTNETLEKIISNQISREEMMNLLNTLTNENDPEVAKMLLDALSQVLAQEGYGERGDLILSAIANFDSPEIASILSEYLIELSINGNTSNLTALQDGLRKVIRQTTDSHQVGSNLAQTFFSANTTQAQEQILAINHPDALVQISLESLNQGDVTTFQTVANRLQQNNSHTAPDAILTLYRKQADTNYQAEAIANLAKAWAQQNATGASLDILEEKLVSGILPEGEQALVLSMLEHSTDPRGKSILEKYQSNSQ